MDVVGCLGRDVVTGRRRVPGGIVHETTSWVVNHVVGSMNLGTLIAGPREHVVAVADLDSTAVVVSGPVSCSGRVPGPQIPAATATQALLAEHLRVEIPHGPVDLPDCGSSVVAGELASWWSTSSRSQR
jgi:hypothetical protein